MLTWPSHHGCAAQPLDRVVAVALLLQHVLVVVTPSEAPVPRHVDAQRRCSRAAAK